MYRRGLSPLKNPWERRPGTARFSVLLNHLRRWDGVALEVSNIMWGGEPFRLSRVMTVLRNNKFYSLGLPGSYACVRTMRALAFMLGAPHEDGSGDWELYRNMSTRVQQTLKGRGLWTFEEARGFRDGLRGRLGEPDYSLGDLVCYTCLMTGEHGD